MGAATATTMRHIGGGERERIERVERLLITPREVIASWRERASERTGDKKGDG